MSVEKTAVFFIANGFDPDNPFHVDRYSVVTLTAAAKRYLWLKERGRQVVFPIIKSVVRDPKNKAVLHQTLLSRALRHGVGSKDIIVLPTETTGSPTDGLSIAIFRKENPDMAIEIFATTPAVARYFRVMYSAVAKHYVGCNLHSSIVNTIPSVSVKSSAIYTALWFVTAIAAKTRWTFSLWWRFLNFAYSRRLKQFSRTVE